MTPAAEAVVRPPNAVILVGDAGGDVPDSMGGELVSATPTCVAVGTLSEADGTTTIRLVGAEDSGAGAQLSPHLAFEGEVEIPTRRLTVGSVLDDAYLERAVAESVVALQIWVDDPAEPSTIHIVIQ